MAEKKKKNIRRLLPILLNALIIIGVFLILVFITLFALDRYTRHNESVAVPALQGFQVEDAARVLKTKELSYEVIDSVYYTNALPGAIIDQVPKDGSHVKKGRTIYLTIKAKGKEMVTIPSLKDYSRRQAEAQLQALGFDKITVTEVPSRFKGLVVRLEYQGKELEPGKRLPKGTPIRMVIGAGGALYDADEAPEAEVDQTFFE